MVASSAIIGVVLAALVSLPPVQSSTDVPLQDVHGRPIDLAAFRGRVILIDAWATWCAPCLAELPRLKALARQHGPRLAIIGVSMDRMPRRDFISWLRRKDVTWPQHFDGRGYDSPAARRLGIDAIPDSWLYDEQGRLVARGLRGPTLEAAINVLIGQSLAP